MEYLIQLFGGIPLSTVIVFVAAIVFLITLCVKLYKIMVKVHDEAQEKEAILMGLKENVKLITEKQASVDLIIEQMATKEELQKIRKNEDKFEKMLKEICQTQKEMAEKQDMFEAQNRSHSLNRLRDRLLNSYRYYTSEDKNPMKAWSEMEQDAFDKLFKDYEDLGGDGFMHSKVEPEMALLQVIPMSDQDRLSQLMKSRKG